MDRAEFIRRIAVYLEVDLPDVESRHEIAETLGRRLFPYVERQREDEPSTSATLAGLLPPKALLFFGAAWDGNTQTYRSTVQEAGRRLGRRVVEIDIDDPVGTAIARLWSVLNTPSVADADSPSGRLILGQRSLDALLQELEANTD